MILPKTLQEGHSEAQTEETQNDTTGAQEAPQEPAIEAQVDAIIADPAVPLVDKAALIMDAAGDTLFSMGKTNDEINRQFNDELSQYAEGKLTPSHVFKVGLPGDILRKTGFPVVPIELLAAQLEKKIDGHKLSPQDIRDLPALLQEPVAVFSYGVREKAQNVIIEAQKDGKNILVGIHFDQNRRGAFISDIRTVFNKDNEEWLNWINQGKLLYANIEKLQAAVAQQQTNPADVSYQEGQQRINLAEVTYLDLESIKRLIQENQDVKDYFPSADSSGTLFQTVTKEDLDRAVQENQRPGDTKPGNSKYPGSAGPLRRHGGGVPCAEWEAVRTAYRPGGGEGPGSLVRGTDGGL
jgi:hypothetical protein